MMLNCKKKHRIELVNLPKIAFCRKNVFIVGKCRRPHRQFCLDQKKNFCKLEIQSKHKSFYPASVIVLLSYNSSLKHAPLQQL